MNIKTKSKPAPQRAKRPLDGTIKTRDWWLSITKDPRFWDVMAHLKERCKIVSGMQDSPHAQSYAGGYRDAWSDMPEELVKIATESSGSDIPRSSTSVEVVTDPDLDNNF